MQLTGWKASIMSISRTPYGWKASIMSIGRTSISYGLWTALRGLRANIMSISRTSGS